MWGEEDRSRPIAYAERSVTEVPHGPPVRIPGAGRIPMENDAPAVARALARFFLG
ncbi:alpha/beta fold hydrolase [Streptomyces eurythermus]|uniref:alpha/beta fold hydrolase n=1 Tax=Streptomyces eurythermus TaxID=42237 RepID=UPI0036ACFEED